MSEQRRIPKSIKPWLALLFIVLIVLVLFPQIAEPVARAEQPGVLKTSMHDNQTLSPAMKRALFQCAAGAAVAVALTFLGPLPGVYLVKIGAMWRLSQEVRAAVVAVESAKGAVTEAELAGTMIDNAVNIGADVAAQDSEMSQLIAKSTDAQNRLQQARDANSTFHRETVARILRHVQEKITANTVLTCVDVFSIPFLDRLAFHLFPDDSGTPSTKELKPGADPGVPTDTLPDSSVDPTDQLFSQSSDQICASLGTTYDATSDACGGNDPAVLSAYAGLAQLVSDVSPADTGSLSPTPDASDVSNVQDQPDAA